MGGESVALLALFDAFAPHRPQLDFSDPAASSAKALATISRNLSVYFDSDAFIDEGHLKGLSAEQRLECLVSQGRQSGLLPTEFTKSMIVAFLNASEAHVRAFWQYAAQAMDQPLVLFRSREPIKWMIAEEKELALTQDYGWQRYTTRPVEVISVPGNHVTMFQADRAQTLAAELLRAWCERESCR